MDKKIFKKIMKYKDTYNLSSAQTLYLMGVHLNEKVHLGPKDVIELMDYSLIDEEGLLVENLNVKTQDVLADKPVFETEKSKQVYIYLKGRLTYRNVESNLAVAVQGKPEKVRTYIKRCEFLLKNKKSFLNPYGVFLSMFPTMETEDNVKWVTFFKVPYGGMELRKKIQTNANRFIKNTKTRDMGIFLYGVYLFIRGGIRGKNTYIAGQAKFFLEWEEWYDKAELKMGAESIDNLFKIKSSAATEYKGGASL